MDLLSLLLFGCHLCYIYVMFIWLDMIISASSVWLTATVAVAAAAAAASASAVVVVDFEQELNSMK